MNAKIFLIHQSTEIHLVISKVDNLQQAGWWERKKKKKRAGEL